VKGSVGRAPVVVCAALTAGGRSDALLKKDAWAAAWLAEMVEDNVSCLWGPIPGSGCGTVTELERGPGCGAVTELERVRLFAFNRVGGGRMGGNADIAASPL
jgi:hypothetical protein